MMNAQQISEICNIFNLGTPLSQPIKVLGGLLHLMWRLDTSHGSFAIKQLSKNIVLMPCVRSSYEQSEQVAYLINKIGIATVSALEHEGKRLFDSQNNTFLVYPWVDRKILNQDTIDTTHALRIASILAAIHQADLDMEFPETSFPHHDEEEIKKLIDQSSLLKFSYVQRLKDRYEVIMRVNQAYQKHIPILQKNTVISHGDLDQKNVLWDDDNNPIVIDWESAGTFNPAQEIVGVALDWSGIATLNFNRELFVQMIQCYQNAGGCLEKENVEAAFWGVCGNWLHWMVYNLQRSCNSDNNLDEQKIGIEQVHKAFDILVSVESLIPRLVKIIANGCYE